MESRILARFIGDADELEKVWDAILTEFPEAELPSRDSGEWFPANEMILDEYECRFEELPERELEAMEGSFIVEEIPEDFFCELLQRFERVYAVFKWSSMEVGVGCGESEAWGDFSLNYADDYSDEAYEISESVLGF